MIYLVDVGNTRIKLGRLDAETVIDIVVAAYAGNPIEAVLTAAWSTLTAPNRVMVASVVTVDDEEQICQWVSTHWALETEFLRTPATGGGIRVAYSNPDNLGVDRWLAMVAARHYSQSACLVVDAGTAITIDGVSADGQHMGGFILPGIALMTATLTGETGRISSAKTDNSQKTALQAGQDTQSCVSAGILAAAVGAVDVACNRLFTDPDRYRLFICGGDAPVLAAHLPGDVSVKTHMVLVGMALLAG